MSQIALYMDRLAAGSIDPTDNVVFDNTPYSSGDIDYDPATGEITLSVPGQYMLQWWVSAQLSLPANGLSFSLASSGNIYPGNTIFKTGQVSGFAIIEVTDQPITVFLRNDSPATVYYSSNNYIKASIMITGTTPAFGSRMAQLGFVSLTDGEPVQIPLTIASNVYSNISFSEPNAITIIQPGVYRVDAIVVGETLQDATVSLQVRLNGSVVPNMTQSFGYLEPDISTFSLTNFLVLEAGDLLTMTLTSPENVDFYFSIFGIGAVLTVQQIL